MEKGAKKYAYAHVTEQMNPVLRYKVPLPQKTASPPPKESAEFELIHEIRKKSAIPKPAPLKITHQQGVLNKEMRKAAGPALEESVSIRDITFRKAPNGMEVVFIHSNRFFKPVIFALEGRRPRLVVDIKGTSYIKQGLSTISVGGALIRQIRSHLSQDSKKLRIVLDLDPSKDFVTNQIFYDKNNIYSLEVIEEKGHEGAGPRKKDNPREEIAQKQVAQQQVKENKKTVGSEEEGNLHDSRTERVQRIEAKNNHRLTASLTPVPPHENGEKIQLRDTGWDLDESNVRETLFKYNFYSTCAGYNGNFCNPDGRFHNLFMDNGNGTVSDHVTGLMWEKNGSLSVMTWKEAKAYVYQLNLQNFAGYSDWRLPTLEELASLMEDSWKNDDLFIDTFFDKNQRSCWSADTHGTLKAWKANFHLGYIIDAPLTYKNSVRAARSPEHDRSFRNRASDPSQITRQ